ncbi:MAG: tol-pal system YbgF family protein, partial [Desulfamplus sp.]
MMLQNSSLYLISIYRTFFSLLLISALLFFSLVRIESCSASNLYQLTTTGKSESATKGKSKSTIIIDADMQYSYASELFNHNDFNTAIVEFSRFIHFFSDDNRITDAIFKKGVCLFNTKQYKEAVKVFRDLSVPLFENYISDNIENSYRLRVDSLFMLSSTFAAMNQDGSAEMVLQDFLLLNDEPEQEDRALYALALLYLKRAEESKIGYKESLELLANSLEYIDKMTPLGRRQYKAEALAIDIEKSIQIAKQNKKSPAIAGVASIVPGGGFAYCN